MDAPRFVYPATFTPQDDGSILVEFIDLIAATDGGDPADAYAQAVDCLEEAIAAAILDRVDIPVPSRPKVGQRLVPVPAQTAAKAAVYLALRDAGMSKVELAKRLGWDEKEVRRMLDPRYATKIPRIEQALHALGGALLVGLQAIDIPRGGRPLHPASAYPRSVESGGSAA